MSTILKILVPAVPPHNGGAYAFADALALRAADLPPNPRLLQFAAALTERYPCWSSGAYAGEAGRAACPWTETPLTNCFRGDMGIIGITGHNPEVVPFVLRRAGAFALTVIDQQGGKVYRPATFCVTFRGVQKNVNTDAMVSKLMPLLKATREEVLTATRTPGILLKCRLDYVTAKRFVATMDLIGCDCTIEKEVLVPAAGAAAAGISAAAAAAAAAAPPAARTAATATAPDTAAALVTAAASATTSAPNIAPTSAPASAPAFAQVSVPNAEASASAPALPELGATGAAAVAPASAPALTGLSSAEARNTPAPVAASTAAAATETVTATETEPGISVAMDDGRTSSLPATLAPGPDMPIIPTTNATARLAMARFEVAEPDGRRRRRNEEGSSPSWFARVFGRASRS